MYTTCRLFISVQGDFLFVFSWKQHVSLMCHFAIQTQEAYSEEQLCRPADGFTQATLNVASHCPACSSSTLPPCFPTDHLNTLHAKARVQTLNPGSHSGKIKTTATPLNQGVCGFFVLRLIANSFWRCIFYNYWNHVLINQNSEFYQFWGMFEIQ